MVEDQFIIDPVIKMYIKLSHSQIKVVQDCIEKIQKYIAVYFSPNEDMTYQMLDILFNFVHDRRSQFHEFLGIIPLAFCLNLLELVKSSSDG